MNDPKAAAAYHPGDVPVTRPDLDAIQARADAATPGPWAIVERNGDPIRRKLRGANDQFILGLAALLYPEPADESFITHAREDVPALLAALADERARADQAERRIADALKYLDEDPDGYIEYDDAARTAAGVERLLAPTAEP